MVSGVKKLHCTLAVRAIWPMSWLRPSTYGILAFYVCLICLLSQSFRLKNYKTGELEMVVDYNVPVGNFAKKLSSSHTFMEIWQCDILNVCRPFECQFECPWKLALVLRQLHLYYAEYCGTKPFSQLQRQLQLISKLKAVPPKLFSPIDEDMIKLLSLSWRNWLGQVIDDVMLLYDYWI